MDFPWLKEKSNNFSKAKEQEIKFYHPLFLASPFSRSFARVISYVFFIVVLGIIAACLISGVDRLVWAGVFLSLIVLDFLIHLNDSSYSVKSLFSQKVYNNNIALCANRESIGCLLNAFEKVESMGGDLEVAAFMCFLDIPQIAHSLNRLDIPIKDAKRKIEDEFEKLTKSSKKVSKEELLEQVKKILISAAYNADFHSRESIDTQSVFSSLALSGNPIINKFFDYFSVDPKDLDAALVFGKFIKKSKVPTFLGGFALKTIKVKPHRVNRTFTSRPTPTLDYFSKDLTDLARAGVEGFLIGHQNEYQRLVDALSRPGRRNALLVGEPGVGKESMVSHLAFEIISDQVPPPLFDRRLVKLSTSELIAGANSQELSERLSAVVNEIISAGNIILYIPEIHLFSKTSNSQGMQLSDFLVPIINSDAFPIIGSTYPKEYKQFLETRSDLASAFEVIRVSEITPQEAVTLLTYEAIIYEQQFGIRINLSAIRQSVELAVKYFRYKPLPSSALDILKEAVSWATSRQLKEITGNDIISIVERKINVPIHKTGRKEAQMLLNLEQIIHQRYINQEEAVTSVAQALRAYRSGLSRRGGPIATFLFVGPTGVGKTELSKIIADIQFGSEKYMVRFDMSEYQEKESIARFIGSVDGKIAGSLTEAIIHQPYSLILLDEFEKAHADILNLFLQVFDEGRLTDSLGRVVDFQNTIIIATSNAHSVYIQEQISQGRSISDFSEELKKKLFDYFRPELINRFSDIVVFKPLSLENIKLIARLNLDNLSKILYEAQGIEMVYDDLVVEKIAQIGFDPAFGARPLRRAIDENIKSTLSKMILSEEISKGDKLAISVDSLGKFVFNQMN
jgi:ATP-dependent Clp protease ATP-binding subunit ClpC